MGSLTANWVAKGTGASAANPTTAIHELTYHYISALSPLSNMAAFFLSVHIHVIDFLSEAESRLSTLPQLPADILQKLVAIMYAVNLYIQSFESLRQWLASSDVLGTFRIVIREDRPPSADRTERYNGSFASEISAVVRNARDGIVSRRGIVLRRRGKLNRKLNETLDTVSVTHTSYDPLSFVLFLPCYPNVEHMGLTERQYPKRFQAVSKRITSIMFYSYHFRTT